MITKTDYDFTGFGIFLDQLPYDVTKSGLYDVSSLYKGYNPDEPETFDTCYDQKVYRHFLETGKIAGRSYESMARSLHDHFIRKGIMELTSGYDKKKVVGVMGGSAMRRTDEAYRKVALLSKMLTESGSLMISGGGPGAMEATSLGALMAGRSVADLDDALSMLAPAPCYCDNKYIELAFRVLQKYPQQGEYNCLAIPTWLYGHEPTAPFASHIAKLFENSIREDLLLTIAYGGLVYAPGSAGTMQEIFQEAVQNHYLTLGFASPMVFLDEHYWREEMPAYTMLTELSKKGKYKNLILSVTDDPLEAAEELKRFQNS